jgi:hypothetical protein
MKTLSFVTVLAILTVTSSAYSQARPQLQEQQQQQLQTAQEGCQKPLGYFPTPSKLICLLSAIGVSEKDIKPKALALIFNTCRGHSLQPQPAGVTLKSYSTLGTCLSDPVAIASINKELTAQGFLKIKVMNPAVLGATQQPAPSAPLK